MKVWWVRNRWAFPAIVLTAALIGVTVVYPAWWRNVGYLKAAQAVSTDQVADIDGVRWQLKPVTLPEFTDPESESAGTRPVAFVLTHVKDGTSFPVSDLYSRCAVSVVDKQGRRWRGKPVPLDLVRWQEDSGWKADCRDSEPVLVFARVPPDAHITAVELLLSRKTDGDEKVAPDPSASTTVVRFDAG